MENINFEGQPVNPEQNSSQNMNQNSDQNMNLNEAPRSGGAPNDGSSDEGKRKKKLIWAGVILAALILAVASWQYWQYTHSVYYQQMKYVENFEKGLRKDTIGGKTPEEVLSLFTIAIKSGDFNLASKYAYFNGGVEESIARLNKIKELSRLDIFIHELENAKIVDGISPNYKDAVIFENGKQVTIVSLSLNEKNGVWKILEF